MAEPITASPESAPPRITTRRCAWWEGEDLDPESGVSHITKLIATAAVLRDAMYNEKLEDDRPPKLRDGWIAELNRTAGEIIDRLPDAKAPFTELGVAAYEGEGRKV
jgi:hypothetical protein